MTTLTGCASQTIFSGKTKFSETSVVTFCDGAEPIYWSAKDTDETIKQIKVHNTVGTHLKCPKWVKK